MVRELSKLTSAEQELVYKAPFLVSILIAGADGKIDRTEIREAIRFAEHSVVSSDLSLRQLMHEIATDFEDKLRVLLQHYPRESASRNPMLVEDLSQLNAVWSKLETKYAIDFYDLLINIARHIAESSGGLMGIRSVGSEEARYINLSMLQKPDA